MKTPEYMGAIAGSEAKGLVYASIEPGTLQTKNSVHATMHELQAGRVGYEVGPRTYFRYTPGYVQANLGHVASEGKVRNGFVSFGDEGAFALTGDLAAFSYDRPWLALNDFIERNGGSHPRIQAIRALLDHPEGLSVADLNDFVYGEGHRDTTGPYVYYRQLENHGIAEIYELPGAGNGRDAKTRVVLIDDVIDDCLQVTGILEAHAEEDSDARSRGLKMIDMILERPEVMRELVRKSFMTSPWAQKAKERES